MDPLNQEKLLMLTSTLIRSLFGVKKDLKLDMNAARTLGISEEKYEQALDRVSQVEQDAIDEGEFRPYTISPKIEEAFQTSCG